MCKIIITDAFTWAIHTPYLSEYLPFRTEHPIEKKIRSCNADAAVVHIFARSPEMAEFNAGSLNFSLYTVQD